MHSRGLTLWPGADIRLVWCRATDTFTMQRYMRPLRAAGRSVETNLDGLIEWLIPRVGEQTGCAAPLFGVSLVCLLIPLLVGWLPGWYVVVAATMLSVAFLLGLAFFARLHRESQRRRLVDWTSDLRKLDADEFEWLVYEVFTREGFRVQKLGSQSRGDGNIDLLTERAEQHLIVQCKRWTANYVGPRDIREFAGTFDKSGPTTGRVFVTLSKFTDEAIRAAAAADVELVDGEDLAIRLEKVRQSEPCPLCGTAMVLDRSRFGWWFHCPRYSDGCTGKRDLDRDPGRAVALLVNQTT